MKRKRRPSKGKKINLHFWIFCEGETEEAYIRFLRSEYRISVEIISKIAGSRIDKRFIDAYKKVKITHKKDKNFLMYDADVPKVLDKLKKIDNATFIASNPTIELWFLLHYKKQRAPLSGDDCIRELEKQNRKNYKKGTIDDTLKAKLRERRSDACNRSKQLKTYKNPFTDMHIFIDKLEAVKSQQTTASHKT